MSNQNQIHRRKKIWLIVILIPVLLIGAYAGYMIWYLASTHVNDPAGASTRADVTYYTSVPPPPEAHDIRVAAFEYVQARLTFVRFLAPVDICVKYAAAVMPNTTLKPVNWDQEYRDLGAIYAGANKLHDLRWFDLPYANSYWTIQSGQPVFRQPSPQNPEAPEIVGADANTEQKGYLTTSVRVDVSRGVFYFLQEN
ncbi:MAG: hypothetical protein ABSB74_00850 [Tepidisphaeraceae bacterium]